MIVIEIIMAIVDFVLDFLWGLRYGFGSWLWMVASLICLFLAVFLSDIHFAFGILFGIVTVICFIMSCRCGNREIKKHGNRKQAKDNERN